MRHQKARPDNNDFPREVQPLIVTSKRNDTSEGISSSAYSGRNPTRRNRLFFLECLVVAIAIHFPVAFPFQVCPSHGVNGRHAFSECRTRIVHRKLSSTSRTQLKSYNPNQPQDGRDEDEGRIDYPGRQNGDYYNGNGINPIGTGNNYMYNKNGDDSGFQRVESIDPPITVEPPSPDRAISIVSELKSNAALFAAFAYGSLNLPSTLTVSESKVTSVTTSLSISRPLPESDLIRTFVVLDICTLCLMISCVAASQLLIYRLTDGSYEDLAENPLDQNDARNSALGRLVTTYRNEFTVARITFDLGLVTLLLAVLVRSLAIFDEDIVVPVAGVLGVTALFLVIAYLTTYVEVFRTAENLTERPLFSIVFPFLSKKTDKDDAIDTEKSDPGLKQILPQIILPISLITIGVGLFVSHESAVLTADSNLSRLGPYDVTPGAAKLKVVTERIDSERGKLDQKAKNDRKKARVEAEAAKKKAEDDAKKQADEEAKKKAQEEAKKKADAEAKKKAEEEAKKKGEEEAKKKAEVEAKKKAEFEAMKKGEEEAKKKAEDEAKMKAEEAAAAEARAKDAAAEAAKRRAEEDAAAEAKAKAEAAVIVAHKKEAAAAVPTTPSTETATTTATITTAP